MNKLAIFCFCGVLCICMAVLVPVEQASVKAKPKTLKTHELSLGFF